MALFERIGARLRRVRFTRVIRRIHLYAGLLLLPWIFLFGLSGMLFNHPNLGEEVVGRPLARADLGALQAWSAQAIAERVVGGLNADGARYRLDPEAESELTGFTVLSAPSARGQHMLLLDMERAEGVLVSRTARQSAEGSRFPKRQVVLPDVSTKAVEQALGDLLRTQNVEALGALRAHPKIAPELRFRVLDAEGARWNVSYDLGSGMVSGRRSDVAPNLGLTQLLSQLHTTHHFPLRFGALWLWALFADLLGITMVFWAVSGLIMWWQLKPTRTLGLVALAIALGLAGIVVGGTAQHLTFGDVAGKLGPGE